MHLFRCRECSLVRCNAEGQTCDECYTAEPVEVPVEQIATGSIRQQQQFASQAARALMRVGWQGFEDSVKQRYGPHSKEFQVAHVVGYLHNLLEQYANG